MKKLFFILILVSLADSGSKNGTENNVFDEYYVKYEVSSSTIYYGGKLNVIINTENNNPTTLVINTRQTWEIIIGPVQKGFNTTLVVYAPDDDYGHLKLYANIYVSKNDSPFAIKKSDGSDTSRDSVEINYTIGY